MNFFQSATKKTQASKTKKRRNALNHCGAAPILLPAPKPPSRCSSHGTDFSGYFATQCQVRCWSMPPAAECIINNSKNTTAVKDGLKSTYGACCAFNFANRLGRDVEKLGLMSHLCTLMSRRTAQRRLKMLSELGLVVLKNKTARLVHYETANPSAAKANALREERLKNRRINQRTRRACAAKRVCCDAIGMSKDEQLPTLSNCEASRSTARIAPKINKEQPSDKNEGFFETNKFKKTFPPKHGAQPKDLVSTTDSTAKKTMPAPVQTTDASVAQTSPVQVSPSIASSFRSLCGSDWQSALKQIDIDGPDRPPLGAAKNDELKEIVALFCPIQPQDFQSIGSPEPFGPIRPSKNAGQSDLSATNLASTICPIQALADRMEALEALEAQSNTQQQPEELTSLQITEAAAAQEPECITQGELKTLKAQNPWLRPVMYKQVSKGDYAYTLEVALAAAGAVNRKKGPIRNATGLFLKTCWRYKWSGWKIPGLR